MIRTVEPRSWREAAGALRGQGYDFFDWLGAADEIGRSDTLRVLLALRRMDRPGDLVLLQTSVPRGHARLDSLAAVFAGASWHEREAAELFGIEFAGGDARRLLLDPGFVGTPLRKEEVLAARAAQDWPGAKEPGESVARPEPGAMRPEPGAMRSEPGAMRSEPGAMRPEPGAMRPEPVEGRKRRMVPPGVPDPDVWGDRQPDAPAADPAEIADSLTGGRTRRRRT